MTWKPALGAARAREALLEEQAQTQRQAAAQIMPTLMSPPYAELEQRRWGPGGRAHFADPRPGDFPGPGTQPHPHPQPETGPEIEATA
jgi:hypothetical protein